jgi:hypothetical protein
MAIEPRGTATMPPLLAQPVEQLLALLETRPSHKVIALGGVLGSGKTTLVSRLADAVNARTAPDTMLALGMDGFHFTRAALRHFPNPEEAVAQRGAPWTFDAAALEQRLQALRASAGRSDVPWPGVEHALRDPVEDTLTVPASTRLEAFYAQSGWEACPTAETRIGTADSYTLYHELRMMRFISPQAKQAQSVFLTHPLYIQWSW